MRSSSDGPDQRRRNADVEIIDPFQRARHARYFENDVLYHVIFRVTQGFFLLTPDAEGLLRSITAGIIGHGRETYPKVRNYATALLSNHGHLEIGGNSEDLAAYVGFIKRELSRRWGREIGWRGIFEEGYHATALITPRAQERCLKYILSQGVHEGLVETPQQWPGFHCAESLVTGEPCQGVWFDGTKYGTAFHREKRKRNPVLANIRREDYFDHHEVRFDKLPAMGHLSDDEYRQEMAVLVDEVVAEGREQRQGREPLGVEAILAADRMTRSEIPLPPWFEDRRRMVVWDEMGDPAVQAYLERYWIFQGEFRVASVRWLDGDLTVRFPPGAFRPGLSRPIPHLQSIVG